MEALEKQENKAKQTKKQSIKGCFLYWKNSSYYNQIIITKQRKTKKNKYKQNSVKNCVKNCENLDKVGQFEQSGANWKKVE